MINMPGGPEVVVIFVVALVVLGPQQLPKAMRTLGSVMAEVRKVSNSFQAEVRNAMDTVVDTSASEKPPVATRPPAAATPTSVAATPPAKPTADSVIDEVVARNEGGAPGVGPIIDGEAPAGAGPVIDPIDRAAG